MSYQTLEKIRFIFDGYSLGFIFLTSIYGLLIDVKQSRNKETNRDARISKRIYITTAALIVSIFIILRII